MVGAITAYNLRSWRPRERLGRHSGSQGRGGPKQGDKKTQSDILTRSSKGGGSSNLNMLRFEDQMGSEEIFVQAEKDWNSLIKHDEALYAAVSLQ